MKYEVEQKFPVGDMAALESKLVELGAVISGPQQEKDLYYSHPARDFRTTDEALRIRRVGHASCITYKGPKVDRTTKTRREIELPLSAEPNTTAAWQSLLEALGFQPVAEVRKHRRKAVVSWRNRRVEVSLDDVVKLGTFVELELVVEPDDIEPAKACIASLAKTLALSGSERRGYLELLIDDLPRR